MYGESLASKEEQTVTASTYSNAEWMMRAAAKRQDYAADTYFKEVRRPDENH